MCTYGIFDEYQKFKYFPHNDDTVITRLFINIPPVFHGVADHIQISVSTI